MAEVSSEVKKFIKNLLKSHPETKQPEIFKKLKAKFGHAVAPLVIKHIRDELGQESPTAEKKHASVRAAPVKAAPKNGRRKGAKKAAKKKAAPKNGRRKGVKKASPGKRKKAASGKRRGRPPKAAQAEGAIILEAAIPGESAPKKRGRGRRAADKRKITMEQLYDYLVVLMDGEQVIPFQTSSKAMARQRIEELLQQGFREENIAFYERAKYGIKATVSVKF